MNQTVELMTIELRLTDVDPPTSEPARTIYHDIASLPDPVIQGITIRFFNYDDVSLYFKIAGSGTGYTFTPANLGLLASGANAYKNLDQFASRARPTSAQLPSGEMMESIVLTLTAYTDAGYTNLKWTFNRTVTVIWLNSGDAAFTLDELDNFDDGTVQGWAADYNVAVVTDYVLSVPYSLRTDRQGGGANPYSITLNAYKQFTTPNKNEVYAIFDIRNSGNASTDFLKSISIVKDSTVLSYLGNAYDTAHVDYVPQNKWIRIIVPLPKSTTFTLHIWANWLCDDHYVMDFTKCWLDDFKIISK
jgi:hypothetical protein